MHGSRFEKHRLNYTRLLFSVFMRTRFFDSPSAGLSS